MPCPLFTRTAPAGHRLSLPLLPLRPLLLLEEELLLELELLLLLLLLELPPADASASWLVTCRRPSKRVGRLMP